MSPPGRQKLLGVAAAVLFIAAGVFLARGFLWGNGGGGEELGEAAKRGLGAASVSDLDPGALPEQGEMSDRDYARLLIELREQADREATGEGEPGSARRPAGG